VRILIVDDEPNIIGTVAPLLRGRGYEVFSAMSGRAGVESVERDKPDLVILDLGLPDMDGVDVCAAIRQSSAAPILVLSARGGEGDKVRALDAGADDYVTKPFGSRELLARVRAALRRAVRTAGPPAPLPIGRLTVDLAQRQATGADGPVHLTPLEYRVLECLVRARGLIVTRDRLVAEVWGPGRVDDSRSLRVYVKLLRQKLEPDPERPRFLVTEAGVGYRLEVD
jgi:two-component system KDP operon response regulator KdpE